MSISNKIINKRHISKTLIYWYDAENVYSVFTGCEKSVIIHFVTKP